MIDDLPTDAQIDCAPQFAPDPQPTSRAKRWPNTVCYMAALISTLSAFPGHAGEPQIAPPKGFIEHFAHPSPEVWRAAHYAFSHPFFDTDWSRDNVTYKAGLNLSLSPQYDRKNRFSGASLRRVETSHYGRYSVVMRPARGDGIVTGFFTYTGPYYGARHDEIDIEFLGQDTTKMHVAWFVDGALQNHVIPLGFDAADSFRRYSFEWLPDRLRWFVADELIFEVTETDTLLPKEPGFLFANVWAVSDALEPWAGRAVDTTKAQAIVREIAFTPAH
ncbi:family 16 glycosylhydrolase [Shimia sp. R10_1]|uniref:family 16 glycosylhydrolase n=1 Tax=Shimia sp. R10_1 TaxID=2821095 RepID=UPI001ADAC4B6|nr:family 16 glycosylhydrolase [Shimia sp. R10_1]MBO9475423.1 family 16 glycosylhydrolase [Shimia sp. R10_1]